MAVIDQLSRTGPWVRFFSVMTFLASVGMAIAAVAFLFMGGFIAAVAAPGTNGPQGSAVVIGISLFYAVLAGLYFYPAMKLWKYANRISSLAASHSEADLVHALNEQRGFWKFACIAMIAGIVLFFIAALLSPLFTAGMRPGGM